MDWPCSRDTRSAMCWSFRSSLVSAVGGRSQGGSLTRPFKTWTFKCHKFVAILLRSLRADSLTKTSPAVRFSGCTIWMRCVSNARSRAKAPGRGGRKATLKSCSTSSSRIARDSSSRAAARGAREAEGTEVSENAPAGCKRRRCRRPAASCEVNACEAARRSKSREKSTSDPGDSRRGRAEDCTNRISSRVQGDKPKSTLSSETGRRNCRARRPLGSLGTRTKISCRAEGRRLSKRQKIVVSSSSAAAQSGKCGEAVKKVPSAACTSWCN
mmetsp:Transcript_49641/g.160476  ORF Transcript_49641/g.160476 Transcript_49641/m.160476 type:complete len:270 (-) Transcript_49641:880-1689(-)